MIMFVIRIKSKYISTATVRPMHDIIVGKNCMCLKLVKILDNLKTFTLLCKLLPFTSIGVEYLHTEIEGFFLCFDSTDTHNLEPSNGVNVIIVGMAYKARKDMTVKTRRHKSDPVRSEWITDVVDPLIQECCGTQHQPITRCYENNGVWTLRKKAQGKVGGHKLWIPLKMLELNGKL